MGNQAPQTLTLGELLTLIKADLREARTDLGDRLDGLQALFRQQNGRVDKLEDHTTLLSARVDAALLRVGALEKINASDDTKPVTRGQVRLVWWTLTAGFSVMSFLAYKFGPALVKLAQVMP